MEYVYMFCLIVPLLITEAISRDPVAGQLQHYNETFTGTQRIETSFGVPVPDFATSLTVGPRGPMLLQDVVFLDTMASFSRERIPERVVHAKGSGAFGYFEVTKDITKYTKAKLFSAVGKRTRIAVRFSLATGERGSAETIRNDRGFAIKFYTEDGIWDLVGCNTPVAFFRDAMLLPAVAHAFHRNPVTNIHDSDMVLDLLTRLPQTAHRMIIFFSDYGIPDGHRKMDGYGLHAFKMVNAEGNAIYVKFRYLTDQGVGNLSPEKAAKLVSSDPDYATRDLYNAIASGNHPSWTFCIQVMTFDQAEKFRWNPFDVTKIWPEDEYPLIEVGKLVLNENPVNYFTDVEQIAFNPGHMPPGIEPSPDRVLQGRLFVYSDTQRHRIGPNYLQLPVNCPFRQGVTNYERDGPMRFRHQSAGPNYFPNSFKGPTNDPWGTTSSFSVSGEVKRFNANDDDNYSQAAMYWNSLSADHQDRVVANIVDVMRTAMPSLQDRTIEMLSKVNITIGGKLKQKLASVQTNKL